MGKPLTGGTGGVVLLDLSAELATSYRDLSKLNAVHVEARQPRTGRIVAQHRFTWPELGFITAQNWSAEGYTVTVTEEYKDGRKVLLR